MKDIYKRLSDLQASSNHTRSRDAIYFFEKSYQISVFAAIFSLLLGSSGHTQQNNYTSPGLLRGEYVDGELLIKSQNNSQKDLAALKQRIA